MAFGFVRAPERGGANDHVMVLYLAHDLGDAAIQRRITMLEAGGAKVALAGFERRMANGAMSTTSRPDTLVLGQTGDGRMAQRAMAVLSASAGIRNLLRRAPKPDVIMARNLEMLMLARRIAGMWGTERPALVYEVLDIHGMMLGSRPPARILRGLEHALSQQVDLVLTSSPGFIREYFRAAGHISAPIHLVENKSLDVASERPVHQPHTVRPDMPPLVIGWFGILRCAVSLACLDQVTRAQPGRYKVILRGKPALDAVPDFHRIIEGNPDMQFLGAYRPQDLPMIYGEVHVAWLGDRFQAGQNSDWLLPNRLYEACAHGAVPLALAGTETARFLAAHGLDLTMAEIAPAQVAATLQTCDLAQLQSQLARVDAAVWTASRSDCTALVAVLAGARQAPLHRTTAT